MVTKLSRSPTAELPDHLHRAEQHLLRGSRGFKSKQRRRRRRSVNLQIVFLLQLIAARHPPATINSSAPVSFITQMCCSLYWCKHITNVCPEQKETSLSFHFIVTKKISFIVPQVFPRHSRQVFASLCK